MLGEVYVPVLLGQNSCCRQECGERLLYQLSVGNRLFTKPKLRHDSMKLRVE